MKGKSPIKIALSIIFTFVLTLVMIAVPSDIASADLISQLPSNSVETECSTEIIQSLEKFVKNLKPTADVYVNMASTYEDCGNYTLAEKRYNKAIKLAKTDNDLMSKLVARYGLEEIKFLTKKIDEDEYIVNTKDIKDQLDQLNPIYSRQCVCTDLLGRDGKINVRCIAPCP